jgi:hypothetical protein
MKLPDGHNLQPEEYHVITDPWKLEWERGVQVICLCCIKRRLEMTHAKYAFKYLDESYYHIFFH